MSSVNKAVLVGYVGLDPVINETPGGNFVGNISLATSRFRKDRATGEREQETEWHRLVVYDALAERARDYVRKGTQLYIEGRLRTRKWTDRQGVDRYVTEIVVERLTMLGSRSSDQAGGRADTTSQRSGADQRNNRAVSPARAAPRTAQRTAPRTEPRTRREDAGHEMPEPDAFDEVS